MACVSVNALIELFRQALDEKWGYIWGAAGQLWTQAKQDAATREMTVKHGQKWVGRKVADCSGLFSWAFKQMGSSIYHGSNTIWRKYCTAQGDLKNGIRIDGQPLKHGTAMFLKKSENSSVNRHHIGLYVGNDTVIEAKGTAYGVVTSKPAHWHEWGELAAVIYEGSVTGMEEQTTIQRGSKGTLVQKLQSLLLEAGYALPKYGADGNFGAETEAAVKQYQTENNLEATGICDSAMWDRLTGESADTSVPSNEPVDEPSADVEGDLEADFDALLDELKALTQKYGKYDKE